jgi:hypothetical protein
VLLLGNIQTERRLTLERP